MQRILRSTFPATTLAVLLLLSACQTVTSTNLGFEPSAVATYDCEGRTVTARFSGNRLQLQVDDARYRLGRVRAASGARYATGDDSDHVVFWDKGESALLQTTKNEQQQCSRRSLRSVREILPFEGRGNEPGWQVTVSEQHIRLINDYGNETITVPRTEAHLRPNGYEYTGRNQAHTITVQVDNKQCRDGMSGRSYPATVQVQRDDETLRGCGGDRGTLLVGEPWQVERLDGRRLGEDAQPTLRFTAEGRLAGSTSCNRYTTSYSLADGFRTGAIATTRKACEQAVMNQEQTFLDLLGRVRRLRITPEGTLRLITSDGSAITARQGPSE